jgi:hypothetical protein
MLPARLLGVGSLLSLCLLATACESPEPDPVEAVAAEAQACAFPRTCNGAAELCDRRYDQVTYPTTHNGYAAEVEGFLHPDQRFGVARQLADGIQAIELDVHDYQGQPYLCHGSCDAGKRPLVDALADLRRFMRHHPDVVVTIFFEPYVDPARIQQALVSAHLDGELHTQALGQPWPTLRQMIQAHHRLVVFTEHDGGAFPWYHDVWAYAWETNWEFYAPAEMTFAPNRGDTNAPLFIFNHMMVTDDDAATFAQELNATTFLLGRAQQCQDESGHRPNFVKVDYYDVGDLFHVVRELNGLAP